VLKERLTLPVLALGVLQGCVAGPALGQPDPVITRLDRGDARLDDMSADNVMLRERITDTRFTELSTEMIAFKIEMKTELAKLHELVEENHRVQLAKLDNLEDGQHMPWWIAMTMAGVGVGGGAGGMHYMKGSKKPPEDSQ